MIARDDAIIGCVLGTSVGDAIGLPYEATTLGPGHGSSGYICHTLPGVLHAWFWHSKDYRAAILK